MAPPPGFEPGNPCGNKLFVEDTAKMKISHQRFPSLRSTGLCHGGLGLRIYQEYKNVTFVRAIIWENCFWDSKTSALRQSRRDAQRS